jgi:hypothetical protein
MPGEQDTQQQVEVPPEHQGSPELPTHTPVQIQATTERRLKHRDWIEWLEFGAGMGEVALTVFITVLIVYEVFYAKHQDELASRAPAISFSQNTFSVNVVPRNIHEQPIELVTPEIGLIYNGGGRPF